MDSAKSGKGGKLLTEFVGSATLVFATISPIILVYNMLQASVLLSVLYDAVEFAFALIVLMASFHISFCC